MSSSSPTPPPTARRTGDMVGRGSATLELLYGSLSGMAFGLISPTFAMPFDTIKTKMQAERRFRHKGPLAVGRTVVAELGFPGLYRGMVPILASTGVQKTVLFAANSGARRACENSGVAALSEPIWGTGGLKPAVLVGGVAAAAARTVVETPFELMKVRRQTGGSFRVIGGGGGEAGLLSVAQLKEMYTGATATFTRAALMLGSFFVLCDYTERYVQETRGIEKGEEPYPVCVVWCVLYVVCCVLCVFISESFCIEYVYLI